jgi:hypothetical protein
MPYSLKHQGVEGTPILRCSLEGAAMPNTLKHQGVEGTPILRCSLEAAPMSCNDTI